jgi:hypothetical protein
MLLRPSSSPFPLHVLFDCNQRTRYERLRLSLPDDEYHERTKPNGNGDGDGARFAVTEKNGSWVGPPRIDVTGKGTRVEMRDEKSNCIHQIEEDWKQPDRRLSRVW